MERRIEGVPTAWRGRGVRRILARGLVGERGGGHGRPPQSHDRLHSPVLHPERALPPPPPPLHHPFSCRSRIGETGFSRWGRPGGQRREELGTARRPAAGGSQAGLPSLPRIWSEAEFLAGMRSLSSPRRSSSRTAWSANRGPPMSGYTTGFTEQRWPAAGANLRFTTCCFGLIGC